MKRDASPPSIHPSAIVAESARIGRGTRIWAFAQVREGAVLGSECNVGKGAYVGADVSVGDRCKIENNASLFEGLTMESGVFVGPHAVFTNDRVPRAVNPDGTLQTAADWEMSRSIVRIGASIGAGAVILAGREIGHHAIVGAGAVVTKDVSPHAIVVGNPARTIGWACVCGRVRTEVFTPDEAGEQRCPRCS